jgi:hypothetical protein
MMHTSHVGDVAFVHNGDYSGEIRIVGKDSDGKEAEVEVLSMRVLVDFLSGALRSEIIGEMENMTDLETLVDIARMLGITFSPSDGRPVRRKKG